MKETMLFKYLKISPIEANKIEMTILYLLGNCKKNLLPIYIYKFIALLELEAAKRYANHFFKMDFVAWKMGPVPISFLNYVENKKGQFSYFKYYNEKENKINFYLENKNNDYRQFNWDYFMT